MSKTKSLKWWGLPFLSLKILSINLTLSTINNPKWLLVRLLILYSATVYRSFAYFVACLSGTRFHDKRPPTLEPTFSGKSYSSITSFIFSKKKPQRKKKHLKDKASLHKHLQWLSLASLILLLVTVLFLCLFLFSFLLLLLVLCTTSPF